MPQQLNRITHTAIAVLLLTNCVAPAWAEMNSTERFEAIETRMDSMERENRALKEQLQQAEQNVEATVMQMEKFSSQGSSSKAAWAEKTKFGGYGEMHLNKLKNQKAGGANKDELDFHRFILFIGHEFNDHLRLFSELEFEHGVTGGTNGLGKPNPGKVELEQAYLDFTLNDIYSAKAGVFLLPVGIINETHEPPTFYGVERNPVENKIIPATWWEGGVGVTARLGNSFSLDGAITSGLNTTSTKNYTVRDGRQMVAEAVTKSAAYTARLKWAGLPGVELAGSVQYQADITQGTDPTAGSAMLHEAHAVVNKGSLGLKALYARWNLAGSGPKSVGANQQSGWYVEPAYKFSEQWGVFARHSRWDNQGGDAADSKYAQTDVGVNYWPHPDVVIKLDFQNQQSPAGKDAYDGFNLGVGYQF